MMTPARRLGLGLVALVFVLDQAIKLWVLFGLRILDRGVVPVTPFMDIVLAWNRGISYGLFQQEGALGRWFLILVTVAAVIWLGRWMWRSTHWLTVTSLALIVGGALGNGVDRVVYGAVVDFVHLYWGTFSWYIFNVADAAIVVGVAGLLYESIFPATEKAA